MSDGAGLTGRQSLLRHELLAESIDDPPYSRDVQVFDSDGVVPETQYDNFVDDVLHVVPASPGTEALIQRNKISSRCQESVPFGGLTRPVTSEIETSPLNLFAKPVAKATRSGLAMPQMSPEAAKEVKSLHLSSENVKTGATQCCSTPSETKPVAIALMSDNLGREVQISEDMANERNEGPTNELEGASPTSHGIENVPPIEARTETEEQASSCLDLGSSCPVSGKDTSPHQNPVKKVRKDKKARKGKGRAKSRAWPPREIAFSRVFGGLLPEKNDAPNFNIISDEGQTVDVSVDCCLDNTTVQSFTPANTDDFDQFVVQQRQEEPKRATSEQLEHDGNKEEAIESQRCDVQQQTYSRIATQAPEEVADGSTPAIESAIAKVSVIPLPELSEPTSSKSKAHRSEQEILSAVNCRPEQPATSRTPGSTSVAVPCHDTVRRSPNVDNDADALHRISSRYSPIRITKPSERSSARHTSLHNFQTPKNTALALDAQPLYVQYLEHARLACFSELIHEKEVRQLETDKHVAIIAALEETVGAQKNQIASLETSEAELKGRLKHQRQIAKQMQAYMKGVQNDYDHVNAKARMTSERCVTILQAKIDEIVQEKAELADDYETTIAAIQRSHRTIHSLLHDYHVRLETSESNRSSLDARLQEKQNLLEKERARRLELDQLIRTSVRGVHERLKDNESLFAEKFHGLQASFDSSAMSKDRDEFLQECMSKLKELREMPSLSGQHLQKAEKMLRSIHTSLDAKLGGMSHSINKIQFPISDIQEHIRCQMADFKSEVIKYEHVSREYQEARQANCEMKQKLEIQQQKSKDLHKQVDKLSREKSDVEEKCVQLERDLVGSRAATETQKVDLSLLKTELQRLQSKIEETEINLQAAVSNSEHVQQQRQIETDAANQLKATLHNYEAKVAELSNADQQIKKQMELVNKEQHDRLTKRHSKDLQDLDAEWGNKLHRVTREKGDMKKLCQKKQDAVDRMTQLIKSLESDLKRVNEEATESKCSLELAQRSLEEKASEAALLSTLQKHLKQKSETIDTIEEELNSLRQKHVDLLDHTTNLRKAVAEQEMRQSSHSIALASLREKSDTRLAEQRKKNLDALRKSQEETSSVRQELQNAKLMLNLSNEEREGALKDLQDKFDRERTALQENLDKLKVVSQRHDEDLKRTHLEHEDEVHKKENEHHKEISELKIALNQVDFEIDKKTQLVIARIEQEKRSWMETQIRVSEDKIREKIVILRQELKEEMEREIDRRAAVKAEIEKSNTRTISLSSLRAHDQEPVHVSVQASPSNDKQSSGSKNTPISDLSISPEHKPRRKAKHRVMPGHTVNVATPEMTSQSSSRDVVADASAKSHKDFGKRHGGHGTLSLAELGDLENLDEDCVSFRELSPRAVPETQEWSQLPTLPLNFQHDEQAQSHDHIELASSSSRSQLSDASSAYLQQLQMESQPMQTPIRLTASQTNSPLKDIRRTVQIGTPENVTDRNGRPVSQANTASRMIPSSTKTSRPGQGMKASKVSPKLGTVGASGDRTETTETLHRVRPTVRIADSFRKGSPAADETSISTALQVEVPTPTRKRKSSVGNEIGARGSAKRVESTQNLFNKNPRTAIRFATSEEPRRNSTPAPVGKSGQSRTSKSSNGLDNKYKDFFDEKLHRG